MPPSSGPGALAVVHRVTIATALLGAVAFTAWAIGERDALAAAGGSVASVGIALYLRNLAARLADKLRPPPREG